MAQIGFSFKSFVSQIVILLAVSCVFAGVVNLLRPEPLAWIAMADYEIYADCPESEQYAVVIKVQDVLSGKRKNYLIIDSRDEESFAEKHLKGAINVPYDSLFPVEPETIEQIKKDRVGKTILVIGLTEDAKLLADEFASSHLENVRYLSEATNWSQLGEGAWK